ncbi:MULTISPECIES: hypothetical protein [Flavobacterium]|uniref:Lipoprotein n=1 Tax=Flavobacterium suzhouense TaxID=1529638 RepID=A0ABW5NQU3_9FLAO|nr:hypothetical protein [Flavobacterium sp. AG291]
MKRKHIFTLAAGVLLLASCGPKLHRYSCGGRKRCISHVEKERPAADKSVQKVQTKDS